MMLNDELMVERKTPTFPTRLEVLKRSDLAIFCANL